ncbi:hypothetical protein E8E13_001638 [Curvularia kusanoi]|uniref:Uncharacterized protein n=1 Tax=Curvularia kusanoi TaxID=90978 RepID=A0A9P4WAM8_CURKU|nr:hypothetical protein E8E13_001638 [Curvularia kusanoi]
MAPKRPLYGDFTAAHAGILRRTDNLSASTLSQLPLPPTPAAISPGSSTYTSPVYSPESRLAPSPLAVRKAPAESRFSLKQLTRTLTQKLTKSPSHEHEQEEELQQLRSSSISGLSFTADEEPIRALEQTYIPGDRTSYFPISPVSPISPTSPASLKDLGSVSSEEEEEEEEPSVEYARSNPSRNYGAQTLSSMVPDDNSTQIGHGYRQLSFASNEDRSARPYYDDLASIYASSSIYTENNNRRSTYQETLPDTRDNSALLYDSDNTATGRGRDDSYGHLRRHSRSLSRVLAQKLHQQASTQDNGKTDTISKFIDQYDGANTTTNSLTTLQSANTTDLIAPYASDTDNEAFKAEHQSAASLPGSSRLRFDFISKNKVDDGDQAIKTMQPALAREHAFTQQPGLPPAVAPPLAPAFQYQQEPRALTRPDISEAFTNESYTSYGDTRNLLQIRQSEVTGHGMSAQRLQSSSSYSQPEGKALEPSSSYSQPGDRSAPLTPQEALDHAELIFDEAAAKEEPSQADIPAMWGKRGSLTLLRNKRLTDGSARTSNNEKAEWETVAGDSQQGRMSLDSIADYSSSEGSSNSLGLNAAASVASWSDQNRIRSSSFYSHPSPIRAHAHPFSSSPPRLTAAAASQNAPDVARPERLSSPLQSSTTPVFRFSDQRRHAVEEPYAFAPWTDPYALTDKETQELLASGPNDEILFGGEVDNLSRRASHKSEELEKSSSLPFIDDEPGLERENTFDKLTVVGPKGNLTGSPRGTGMQEVGSSVADTSSPGAKLNSSSPRSDYDGFYASPFPAVGSITRIRQPQFPAEQQDERPESQMTIFPSAHDLEPVQASSPLAGAGGRRSFRNSTTFKPARRASRSAVPGQTRLRQMVLAPDVRSTVSSKDTHFSRFISAGDSTRPSTSDTSTPLHPSHPSLFRPSRDTFPTIRSKRTTLVHQHSPHLLCPEREVKEEDEVRRRKLSWLIFACFCLLPPCIFLYRMWGDTIIVSITKGELGSCTAKSKRAALIAGIVVNIGLIAAILIPILVAQALKAI